MKYDLSKPMEVEMFKIYSNKLIEDKSKIELKKHATKRSNSQNAYLHVCITIYAIEFGYTLDEAKTMLKRDCDFMRYEKNGSIFLKRTRNMDSKELTDFIEWIRNYASMNGLYIPSSEEYIMHQFEIDKEIDKHKNYL